MCDGIGQQYRHLLRIFQQRERQQAGQAGFQLRDVGYAACRVNAREQRCDARISEALRGVFGMAAWDDFGHGVNAVLQDVQV